MNLKLIGFLIALSFYPVGVKAANDQQRSGYWGLVDYLHTEIILNILKDHINLEKNKESLTKEEYKKQEDILLCNRAVMHVEYKKFLKESGYKANSKIISFLDEEEKSLENDFKKYEPNCNNIGNDGYIDKLLQSVFKSK